MPLSEQLRVDTPEQVALEFPIAGVGSRFLALAIDTLLQLFLFAIVVVAVVTTAPALGTVLPGSLVQFLPAIGIVLVFCIYWGYFAIFEIVWRGQTPGKRLSGIRVIKESGRPIDATAAALRNLLRAIDFLPGFYAVGIITMLLNPHSRRLGDFVAGTVVVHDRRPVGLAGTWEAAATTAPPTLQAARISIEELTLIETYLIRRIDLDPAVQDQAAWKIVRRVTQRTGLEPEPGQSVDAFLETVARQARDASRFR